MCMNMKLQIAWVKFLVFLFALYSVPAGGQIIFYSLGKLWQPRIINYIVYFKDPVLSLETLTVVRLTVMLVIATVMNYAFPFVTAVLTYINWTTVNQVNDVFLMKMFSTGNMIYWPK